MEQTFQVLKVPIVVVTDTTKDRRVGKFFYVHLCAEQSFKAPLNSGQYLRTVLNSAR